MELTSVLVGCVIGVVGAFGTGFLKKAGEDCYSVIRHKIYPTPIEPEPEPTHIVIHVGKQDAQNGALETAIQSNGSPIVERVSSITIDDINHAISDAPPLQRGRVSESYIGLRIEWETEFVYGEVNDEGKFNLQLGVEDAITQPRSVWCEVSPDEYREIGILPERAKIRAAGKIKKIGHAGISLSEARLHIYGMKKNLR